MSSGETLAGETRKQDLQALRALTQPLRLQVLRTVGDRSLSVRELAEELDLARNKLHYHVNILERHGLLEVAAGQRGVGERRYRRTARRIEAGPGAIPADVAAGITGILDDAARSLDQQLASDTRGPTAVGRLELKLDPARREDFLAQLQAVLADFDGPDDVGVPVTFVFALFGHPS